MRGGSLRSDAPIGLGWLGWGACSSGGENGAVGTGAAEDSALEMVLWNLRYLI